MLENMRRGSGVPHVLVHDVEFPRQIVHWEKADDSALKYSRDQHGSTALPVVSLRTNVSVKGVPAGVE